jgi:hypothetical protein
MRPNKKGLWLFKTSEDELRAMNIDDNLRTTLNDSIEHYESLFEGIKWIGKALSSEDIISEIDRRLERLGTPGCDFSYGYVAALNILRGWVVERSGWEAEES